MNISTLSYIFYLISFTLALGFKGKIEGIPSINDELFKTKNKIIPNGNNYNNRIKIDLYPANSANPIPTIIDSKYNFKFNSLKPGEYDLIVNSYDFNFEKNRFKIIANDESIIAYENNLGSESFNVTSGIELKEKPLVINYFNTKEFYQYSGGSFQDMIMNSPFGFVFKNRTVTIIFSVCVAIMAAPYILQFLNPEFAAELNEIQVKAAKERLGEKVVDNDSEIAIKSTGVNKPEGSATKKRR
ncbi:hypothetical protein SBY92_005003 [Candida maltosa Xu316]|uniref:ER membrane protein complex subunit 7 beta-sandwich domain-containing protein n=1 Tax=Candida maltosa (strain Xu316) TaxID=1245528 RepID=M3HE57_CANMX|nr:hypothetical protein G210_4316 [Candida maltosa Xu316]